MTATATMEPLQPVYTRRGLITVFGWLLLGDFTLTLMETVMPSLLPLELKSVGAGNAAIGIIVGSIPAFLNVILNPIISTTSDRHRGPRGRRIPFILWPTPFVTICLILIGFVGPISRGLHATLFGDWISLGTFTLIIASVLVVLFQILNLFVASVYCYLFADVVPLGLMGRFLGLMRLVSQLAGFLWGRYIFGQAATHMSAIYVGVGTVYCISFIAMCMGVREGNYPPPPPKAAISGVIHWLRTYFTECFSDRIYICVFLITSLFMVANATNILWVFYCRDELHLSLDQIGAIVGWCSLVSIPGVVILGSAVDKLNAMWITLWGLAVCAGASIFGAQLITGYESLLIYMIAYTVGLLCFTVAQIPMYMMVFPSSRYGQFCSANAMVSSLAIVISNWLVGVVVDKVGGYKVLLPWRTLSWVLVLIPLLIVWKRWRQYGGLRSYVPPSFSGPPEGLVTE
ncbi:MAG TPA: MFS transporter [Tepidisphaeraceae bacterium]|nr:MFS transporter [Tepidisphaeraceae bacterium]